MKYFLFFALVFFTKPIFSQFSVAKNLDQYRRDYLPEKVFLHTDKNIYAAGEIIWMSLYLIDGQTHRPGAFSVFARVELLDIERKVIKELKVFVPKGHASASIELSDDLAAGDYQLLAYTNYQRNSGEATIFRKTIRIVRGLKEEIVSSPKTTQKNSTSQINLRFFPEGGDCVTGLACKMAMVAEGSQSAPVMVEGQIKDETDQALAFFKTGKEGMGQFTFTPQSNIKYQAVLKDGRSFELPARLEKGHILNVRQLKSVVQSAVQTIWQKD